MIDFYNLYKKNRFKIFKKEKNLNFFLGYLFSRKLYDPEWNIVEKQIRGYVIKAAKKYNIYVEEPTIDESKKDITRVIIEQLTYMIKKIRQIYLGVEGIAERKEKIISDLTWFEKTFGEYIENQRYTIDGIEEKLNEIFQLKKRGIRNIKIINFNYTTMVEEILLNLIKSKTDIQNKNLVTQINIHGNTKNPILGIDIKEIEDIEEDEIRKILKKLTKTDRIMESDIIPEDWRLLKEITDINFFGHSLAKSDYSYFQTVFDFYDIYGSEIKLNFFYNKNYDYDGKKQKDCVSYLMEYYGKSLENKEKGKNLSNKMLLGNRLRIIGLDV